MEWLWWWIIASQVVSLFVWLFYFYREKFSYWRKLGVAGPPPYAPLGNLHSYVQRGQAVIEKEWFDKYGKIYGNYLGTEPILTIADPALIKQVLIKDFPNFVNRDVNKFEHEIWEVNLFNAESDHWKRIRSITSPTFTSGKLRSMQLLMNKCVEKLEHYLNNVAYTPEGKDGGEVNIKKAILGFTIDVIASTVFATETNANDDRQTVNPFVENGTMLFDINPLRFVSAFVLPKRFNVWIGNSLGLPDKRFNFFVELGRSLMKQRKMAFAQGKTLNAAATKRHDIVQMLIEAYIYDSELQSTNYDKLTITNSGSSSETDPNSKTDHNPQQSGAKRTLTDNEIIAQCILFFGAGFETTGTTISKILYYLALYPDIQNRLVQELNTTLDGLDVESAEYFETVMTKIPYLEAVVKETLRISPPVCRLQRRVNIDGYQLGGVPLRKDQTVEISVYAVHHAVEFYSEPDRYNPDRFMPENKHLLVPYTYIPFGDGPRNCLGMRFAYQEIKLCLARILPQFHFAPTKKTDIPLSLNKMGILSCKDIYVQVKKRDV